MCIEIGKYPWRNKTLGGKIHPASLVMKESSPARNCALASTIQASYLFHFLKKWTDEVASGEDIVLPLSNLEPIYFSFSSNTDWSGGLDTIMELMLNPNKTM